MNNTTTRNKTEARRIESWILNQIAVRGSSRVAEAIGVDRSRITDWKQSLIPRMAMLLAVLEWAVVDDDLARLARQVYRQSNRPRIQAYNEYPFARAGI